MRPIFTTEMLIFQSKIKCENFAGNIAHHLGMAIGKCWVGAINTPNLDTIG